MTESSNVDVHHCVVHHNGRENAGCITLKYSPDRENSGCKNVTIHNCTIFDNILSAINIGGYSTNIRVCHNEIYGQTSTGIVITENSNAYVYENIIIANGKNTNLGNGILIQDCIDSAVVRRNIISSNNPYGAYLLRSSKNTIVENNFINNTRNNANFKVYFFSGNYWDRNYWDDWRGFGPKIIFGKIYKTWFPWVDFDWNPAGEPYEINL
jgi:parallel beta-helix repeat protein